VEKKKTRIAVTSFNSAGYEKYGQRMIETYRQFWPDDIPLVVVSEDSIPVITDNRIFFHDYDKIVPEGVHFKNKFSSFSEANGTSYIFEESNGGSTVTKVYNYLFDAIRFSHKVFTLYGINRSYDCDEIIWLDGDTYTHTAIDDRFFELVSSGGGHMTYLGRDNMYSECGFLVFNRRNKINDIFFNQISSEYLNGEIFLLQEWHDSFIWDVMRVHYEKAEGIKHVSISGEGSTSLDPFDFSILNEYMHHMKGPERKEMDAHNK